jgi:hypothetical protein
MEIARPAIGDLDISTVEPQLQRIRTALRSLSTIQTHLTTGRGALDGVSREADALRTEIRDALGQIEDALRLSVATKNGDSEAAPLATGITLSVGQKGSRQ